MRLRPILQAFILGVLSLAISTGAGSGSQNAVGTGVIGGMVTTTLLAIFFVVVVRRRFGKKGHQNELEHGHPVDNPPPRP